MEKKRGTTQVVFAHLTIGIQLAITILIFVLGGNWLDNRYQTSPVFLALCTIAGMVIGFYHLMKQLAHVDSKEEKKSEEKRVKWN